MASVSNQFLEKLNTGNYSGPAGARRALGKFGLKSKEALQKAINEYFNLPEDDHKKKPGTKASTTPKAGRGRKKTAANSPIMQRAEDLKKEAAPEKGKRGRKKGGSKKSNGAAMDGITLMKEVVPVLVASNQVLADVKKLDSSISVKAGANAIHQTMNKVISLVNDQIVDTYGIAVGEKEEKPKRTRNVRAKKDPEPVAKAAPVEEEADELEDDLEDDEEYEYDEEEDDLS